MEAMVDRWNGRSFSFSMAWDLTVELFKAHWALLLGVSALAYFILFLASLLPFVGAFAGVFLAPLTPGVVWVGVRAFRGERAEFGDMFAGFRTYWPQVAIGLLTTLILYLPMVAVIVGIVVLVGILRGQLGTAGTIALAVVLGLPALLMLIALWWRLAFAGLLYMEMPPRDRGIFDALGKSWRGMRDAGWEPIWFLMVVSFVSVLTVLLLGVGLILVGLPLMLAAATVTYASVFGVPNDGSRCKVCGYQVKGLASPVCPECGEPLGPDAPPIIVT